MHSLPIFLRLEGRPVILLGEGEAADAKRRLITRAGGLCVEETNADARLAVVALEDDAAAEAAVLRLRARGLLVNAVDRPAMCDFTWPAIVDRDPVLIAIGTGGSSAGLAKALRQRLEALLPASLGELALALGRARATMRKRWPDAAARRRALDDALLPDAVLDPLADGSSTRVGAWLEAGAAERPSTLRHLIINGDDPDQLTLEAARLLGQADTVFHQPDVAPAILLRARADAARVTVDTLPSSLPAGLSLFLERRCS